jgi:choline dehydrogenase
LSAHGIDTIVNSPGVGSNLQGKAYDVFWAELFKREFTDHDEICVVWRMTTNYSLFDGCTFLSDPAEDPCLEFWKDNGHANLYSFGTALNAITSKSSPDLPASNILTYFAPAFFRGFFRGSLVQFLKSLLADMASTGFAQQIADNHDAFTATVLKAHPSSRGTVQLTGSHPQDKLNIQKMHFQAPDGPQDVADLRNAIRRARAIVDDSLIAAFVKEELFPGPQAQSDEDIDNYIYENVFGSNHTFDFTQDVTDMLGFRTSLVLHQPDWTRRR